MGGGSPVQGLVCAFDQHNVCLGLGLPLRVEIKGAEIVISTQKASRELCAFTFSASANLICVVAY